MSTGDAPRRHVLVTGAANGIGAAVCRKFAAAGHRVTGVDQQADALRHACDELSQKYGVPTGTISGDLADESFADRLAPEAWERWGPVDVAVAAAGVYPAIGFST